MAGAATAGGAWSDATYAAALFAVDPAGTGGMVVRSPAGPVRERWLSHLRALMPGSPAWRRMPHNIADGRLLGGLDLAKTLRLGRPCVERGLLADSDQGVVVIPMAERVAPVTAVHIVSAMDRGEVCLERDGLARRMMSRFGVVALDEGIGDERVSAKLADRLTFHIDLSSASVRDSIDGLCEPRAIEKARAILSEVEVDGEFVAALCAAAAALGIVSIRAPLLAVRSARVAAALDGRRKVEESDATLAARLVLAPRAVVLPASAEPADDDVDSQKPMESGDAREPNVDAADRPIEDIVLAAAQAAIPDGLLAQIKLASGVDRRRYGPGQTGLFKSSLRQGRPAGSRKGDPRTGARLDILETLRAAAPWQRLRRRNAPAETSGRSRVEVRAEDFRIFRFKQRTATTTIFVVDSSGSSALHRLAEAKGAVELLLAECYVRRDQVALIAFRGREAELLLPPTRSLVRAKRSLAGLPGGGSTPLASAIDAAALLADSVRRRGQTPIIIFLTDGRANVARDGSTGRERAEDDAKLAARGLRAAAFAALVIDTSPHPRAAAEDIAAEMGARYLALPHADASALSEAVRMSAAPSPRAG